MNHRKGLTRRSAIALAAAGATLPAAATQDSASHPQVRALQTTLLRAHPLPLSSVRLTGGPLKAAQDATAKYLLQLEPDRMLAYYRRVAGLPQKAEPYGGWDGGGRNLTGHIGGHYLSAVSLMWAATGDARFKDRADYLVADFKTVQDKHGDGYLSALEKGRECWDALARGEIRSSGFDLNGQWSPWYVLHKTYAGLRDAWRYTGNRTALDVEIKYAQWAEGVLSKLNDSQIQRMLNTEFGGMSEILADLYADTGDRRWLDLSWKFEHRAFVDPLKRHEDNLAGKHGNTAVPELIGSAARYAYAGDAGDMMAASFFWDRVVQHHSYSTGGHGQNEYFGEPGKLADRVDGRTSESCNIYNMLKLTRQLFALRPDVHYADFLERALFNHVLGSIDPEDGRTCYMVPVGRGVRHEYQNMLGSFTCCVGSGMESHALHGYGIYYESGDRLWVNLYAPSTAEWAGVKIETATDFPEGESVQVKMTLRSPREFTLSLRRPYWVGDGFALKINGQAGPKDTNSYVDLKRTWKTGDIVELTLPKSLRLEATPDNPRIASVMWGPLALAGDLGPEGPRGPGARSAAQAALPKTPVLLAAAKPVIEWLKPLANQPGNFRTDGVVRVPGTAGSGADVDMVPFYRLHKRTYAVYWDMFTTPEWEQKQAQYAAERERQERLEAATVAFVQPGEMQPERDHNFQAGERVTVERVNGVPGRRGNTWFSFDLPVDAAAPMVLVVTYFSAEQRRGAATFQIQVDGKKVADQTIERSTPPRFFEVEYAVPADHVQGKQKVTVRFEATQGNAIATVFGVRMIRANAPR